MGLVPYNNATIPLFCTTPIIYQDVNNSSKYMCGFQTQENKICVVIQTGRDGAM